MKSTFIVLIISVGLCVRTYSQTREEAIVDFYLEKTSAITLEILDVLGRIIYQYSPEDGLHAGAHHYNIPNEIWPESNRIFYLRLSSENACVASQANKK